MSEVNVAVDRWRVEPLNPLTWNAFADLAERHKRGESFLSNATRSMYERPKGQGNCVMSKLVPAG